MFELDTEMMNKRGIELADEIVRKNRDRQNHVGTILNFALNYFNCKTVELCNYDIDRGVNGELQVKKNGADLYYNNRQSRESVRFMIALQIGTYVLGDCEDRYHRSFSSEYLTGKANQRDYPAIHFAINLLIPNKELSEKIRSGVNTISDLANEFNVTSDAMRFKINNCQLFDKDYRNCLRNKNLFNDKKRRILKV